MDLEKLAREAGFAPLITDNFGSGNKSKKLIRFAALVLEEAAQLAERTSKMSAYFAGEAVQDHIAAVIRALKPQE